MTPREIAIAEARRNKLREAFRGLDGNDALSGDPEILAKQRQGKARAANIAWLSNSSGVDTKTIGKVYDVERPIQAKKLFNMSEDPGDEGFYKAISENFDKQDAIRDTAKAAARAAIQSSIISKFEETDTGERVDVPWALQYAEHIKERRTPKFEGPEEEKIYQQAFRNAYAQGSAESAETKKIAIDLVAQLEIKEGVEVAGAITQEKPEIFEKLRLLDKEERGRVYAYINANVDSSKVAPDWAKNSTKAVNRGFQRVYGDLKEFALRDHVALIKRNFGTDRPLAYMSEPDPDDTPAERLARISSVNDLGITTDQSRVSRAGAMSVRRVPDEDLKEIVDFMGEVERDLEIQHELQNIRHQKINPIKTDSWFAENVWYPAQAQLGFMATAMSLYTLPVMLTANTQMRAREMVERGASWDDARRMGAISSILEAPIEYMQVKGVMGGALTRTLRRSKADLSSQLKTLGVSLAGQVGEQNIQEAIQDITPLVVQSLASSLSEEIPGVDWNKELKAYGSERVDTFWALLPFAMLGAGVGSAKDIKNAKHYLGNVDRVKALGVDQKVAEEIVELSATDMDAAGKKFAEAEKGEVNLVAFEGEAAIMEDLINSSDRPRITILEDGRAEVAFESGDTQIFPDVDTAQQATSDFVNTRATEARDAVAKLIKGFQDKEVADITVEDRVMLLEDAVLEKKISPEEARQRIKDLSAESGLEFGDNAFSQFRIYAQNEATFNEGVFRNVVRVFKGDNPFAVVEDVSEGLFKKLILGGERPKLNGWLQQYQEVTGDILLPDIESATDRSMVEAMSALATSYYAGKVQKGSLSNSIKKLFQQLATYFQYVFDRAGRLSEGFKSGELSPEFEAALAESTGLNLEQRQEQATDAAVEAALQEMIADKNADIQKRFDNTFSIGAAAIRKQGFDFKSRNADGTTSLHKGRKIVAGSMSMNLDQIADPSKDVSPLQPFDGTPAQMTSFESGDYYPVANALGLDAKTIAKDKNFRVRRIKGITLPDEYKGMGVGQALRLAHMQAFNKAEGSLIGTAHFYNSQQSPESALSTAALARKGLITITPLGNWAERWKPGMPFEASVTTITEAGRKADPFDLVKPQKVALDIERLRETTSDPLADAALVDVVPSTPPEGADVEAGTPAPESPSDMMLPDSGKPEIEWDDTTFSIGPQSSRDAFPLMTEKLAKKILSETDTTSAIHIDRMRVGEFEGVPLQGGMFYPTIAENLKAGIAWAFNSTNVARTVVDRAAEHNGYVKLVLMTEGNVIGNKTFATIWLNRMDQILDTDQKKDQFMAEFHKVREAAINSTVNAKRRLEKAEADKAKMEGKKPAAPADESSLATYHRKGEGISYGQVREFMMGMTQSDRGSFYFTRSTRSKDTTTGGKKGDTVYGKLLGVTHSKKHGYPAASEIVEAIEDPSFKGMKKGDVVGLIKLDPIEKGSPIETAEEAGVPEHLSYGFVVKGKPVAKMKNIHNIEEMYPSIKGQMMSQQSKAFPAKDHITFSIAPAQLEQQLESFFAPPDFRMDQLTKAHKMLRDIETRFAKKRREAGANKTIVQRVDLVEGVAQFEAILKVLPLSIRGKLTGAAAVAGKATDKGRLSYLFNRIERAAALLDEFIAKDNAAKFEQLVTRSLPKKDASGKLRSTLGPETAQLVTDIAAVMNLDTLSLDGRITQLEEQVGRNLGDVGRVYELIHTAEQFGAIKDMDAIRSSDALELLKSSISSGRSKFRMAQEIRRNRNAELISTAKIEAGAPVTPDPEDVDAVRREEDKAFKKLHEGTKGFLVELLSFRQMLVTVFGYGKTADHFEARAQKAKNEFTDQHLARRKKQEQWMETDLGLTTGRSRIKWLHDLREVKKTEIKTSTGKSIELSQDEAIYYTMVWDQAAYQSNLEKHNDFTQKTIDQMEDWLTPESKQFRSHLQKEYLEDYDRINAVYKALNGVDMPRVDRYAPVSVDTGNVNDLQVEPFGNSLMASGLAAGFTKLRTNHNMKIRRQGASTTFWAHTQQVDYYVAYADMARELRAVFSDPTVRDGIVLKKGTRRAKTVGMWVDQFHNNGARRAAGLLAMEQFSLRMQRATVLTGLAWNFGTLLKQTSAVFGTLTEIPATAWIRGVGAMLVDPKRFSDVFKSRTVQQRIDGGISIEMQVAMSGAETSPSMLMAAMRKGLPVIGMVDAAWTSVGGAIAYDYHLREARKAGASEADARKIAEDRLDLTIGRTAQPAANMDRSLTEINMDANAFGRIYMMFKSDPRQKMAIAMMGIRDAFKTPGRRLQGTQAAFTTLVMMTIATKIMDEWFAMAFRDKDEDDMWDLEALGHAITTGQSSGIPFAGEAIELLSGAAFDQQVWAEGSQIGDTAKSLSQGWNKLLAGEFGKEEDELTAKAMTKDINSITRGMGVIIGGRAAAAGVTSRILKDLANLSDFVTDTETWVGPTDFQKKLDELEELDEAITEAKKDAPADEEKVKLSEDFKRLKALRVGEGTRALGVKALLDSTPEGKKMNLIKELKEAKILTSTVDKQLKKL
ncbi:MAG: hypothetical protein P1U82_12815 [Verrucomicrobiales bacterium]|nr:hypothetical protein [Verrucomicrobiales bacterium]